MPRGKPHYRLTLDDVLAAHDEALEFGGLSGYLDLGAVESAIARPFATFAGRPRYPRISDKAAALIESLVKNHGFADGNKRTALLSLRTLLVRSGYDFAPTVTDDELEQMILDVAVSTVRFAGLVAWFSSRIVARKP